MDKIQNTVPYSALLRVTTNFRSLGNCRIVQEKYDSLVNCSFLTLARDVYTDRNGNRHYQPIHRMFSIRCAKIRNGMGLFE